MSLLRRSTLHRNFEITMYKVNLEHVQWSFVAVVIWEIYSKTEGSRLGACFPHCHSLLIGISAGLSIAQGACHLAVLGQVEGGDLLGLLDLLLVGLHLALQLVNQGLHPLVVLAILIGGKAQLLDGPLGFAEVLGHVSERLVSASSSDSSSRMRVSILIM